MKIERVIILTVKRSRKTQLTIKRSKKTLLCFHSQGSTRRWCPCSHKSAWRAAPPTRKGRWMKSYEDTGKCLLRRVERAFRFWSVQWSQNLLLEAFCLLNMTKLCCFHSVNLTWSLHMLVRSKQSVLEIRINKGNESCLLGVTYTRNTTADSRLPVALPIQWIKAKNMG